jgi:hypothetical protein
MKKGRRESNRLMGIEDRRRRRKERKKERTRNDGEVEKERKGILGGVGRRKVNIYERWMRSSRVAANANVATILGSIPASSDKVESERRRMKIFV